MGDRVSKLALILAALLSALLSAAFAEQPPFRDPELSVEERAANLVSLMTLEEKIAQLNYRAPAIERLGVPAYNWWSEALHGVARNGRATVFPQAIGLAATFDPGLVYRVASVISDEARAKFNAAGRIGNTGRYAGLTFWSPNINIFRDPRWGRGQETYGEDPYLTARIGVAFVKGLQGDDPRYLKVAACAKHYAVHSGPEGERHRFNAVPSKKDFRETYLPAFEALVKEAHVEIVMCAYNRVFGKPCCGSKLLLQDILRGEWGFDGHVTSDCWALEDFYKHHEVSPGPEASAALAFASGVNVNCGATSPFLKGAVEQGFISEEEIDAALVGLLKTRFRLGLFDPPGLNPYASIGPEVVNCERHRDLTREAAEKSIVLLKNDGVLPLRKAIRRLFVIGPAAADGGVLLGNYYGITGNLHTILEGIAAKVDPGTGVDYRQGFLLDRDNINPIDWSTDEAHRADVIIVVMGLTGLLEGEEGESLASPTKSDRLDIALPQNQVRYLKKLRAAGDTPIVVVLTGGSPIAIPEVHELADAVLDVWYPGEEGGTAVANVLFGDEAPSGRLPVTFPKSVEQLPPYESYAMKGRTYRYLEQEPLYPFGFGLSTTRFAYSELGLSSTRVKAGEGLRVEVTLSNTGQVAGEEVVQMYLTHLDASVETPRYELKGFQRVRLEPGASQRVSFPISPEAMKIVNDEGQALIEQGKIRVTVGGSSPGRRARELGAPSPLEAVFTVERSQP